MCQPVMAHFSSVPALDGSWTSSNYGHLLKPKHSINVLQVSLRRPFMGHISRGYFSTSGGPFLNQWWAISQPVVGHFSSDPALDGSWWLAVATIFSLRVYSLIYCSCVISVFCMNRPQRLIPGRIVWAWISAEILFKYLPTWVAPVA